MVVQRGELWRAIPGGLAAGLIAALVMGLTLGALGAPPTGLGLATLLVAAMVWGAFFGALAFGGHWATTLSFGLVWGFFAALITARVLQLVGAAPAAPAAVELAAAGAFGLALGVSFLPFQRTRRAEVLEEPAPRQILPVL
jgi:hypothetical protein